MAASIVKSWKTTAKGNSPKLPGGARSGSSSASGGDDFLEVVATFARLAVSHDRDLREIQNRNQVAIWVHDEDIKQALVVTRQKCRDDEPETGAHPSGVSQKVAMWCVLTIELKKQYEAATAEATSLPAGIKGVTFAKGAYGWEAARAHWDASSDNARKLADIGPEQLEGTILRLEPISQSHERSYLGFGI